MKFGFYFLFIFSVFSKVLACTDFIIGTTSDKFVVGRTLDFGKFIDSDIIVFPKGKVQRSTINGQEAFKWTQKYDYIGLDAFKTGFIVDGFNEMGLAFEGLWFEGAIYPKVNLDNLRNVIPLQDVGNWILGSFSSVGEVKKALRETLIYPEKLQAVGEVPPMHLSFHDRSGRSIVVEFIDGKMQIDDNMIGVLTNTPKFDWHVTNLGNYLNLSVMNTGPTKFDGTVLNSTGQGGGFLGLPGDWTPPSRFVRISVFKDHAVQAKTIDQNVNLAFHFLNNVGIPYGLIEEKDGKSFDYTQWAVVKDLTRNILYYRTYNNLNIRSLDMKTLMQKGFQKIPMGK